MFQQTFGAHARRRGILVVALAAALALHASAGWACHAPPARLLVGVDEQIAAAADVSVATAVDAVELDKYHVEYHFVVVQRLAGAGDDTFTLMGGQAGFDNQDTTFDNHTAPAFWRHGGGRATNGADCAMHPGFVLGQSYLVFRDAQPTWRSYEKIGVVDGRIDEDDQWLAYVKAQLRSRSTSAQPMPLAGAAGPDAEAEYQRVGRFIYAFHRAGVSRDELTGTGMGAAPPALAARARRLAEAFDRILLAHAKVPDEDLAATLREANDLGAALRTWRAEAAQPGVAASPNGPVQRAVAAAPGRV